MVTVEKLQKSVQKAGFQGSVAKNNGRAMNLVPGKMGKTSYLKLMETYPKVLGAAITKKSGYIKC